MNSDHGGKRDGAGRKKKVINYSNALQEEIHKALVRKKKSSHKSFGDVLVDLAYSKSVPPMVRLNACKLIMEAFIVKETKQTLDVKPTGPQIYLPKIMDKPPEAIEREKQAKQNFIH